MFFFVFLTFTFSINAKEIASDKPNEKKIQISEQISNWLDRQTRSIDLALAGKSYTKVEEDSQASIIQEGYWDEIEKFSYRLDFDLDLALPNLEKKYKIMVSNYNKNRIRRSNYSRGSFRKDRRDDYGASVSFLEQIGEFDVTFEPRFEFSDGFGTYYNLRFENQIEMKEKQGSFETRFEFFADSIRGTGQFVALNLEKVFKKRWALSFIFEEEYQDAHNILSLLQGVNLFFDASERLLFNLAFSVESSNQVENRKSEEVEKEKFKLQEVTVGPSFTHMILENEIHYSINYTHVWNREQDFRGYNSASLVVSFIF